MPSKKESSGKGKKDRREAKIVPLAPKKVNEEGLMRGAYSRMLDAQAAFSDIAVSRAAQIARKSGLDISNSHVLGVSFAPEMAMVAVVHTPKIIAPGEKPGPRQYNVPVPAECLCTDNWEPVYDEILRKASEAHNAAESTGALDKIADGVNNNTQEDNNVQQEEKGAEDGGETGA